MDMLNIKTLKRILSLSVKDKILVRHPPGEVTVLLSLAILGVEGEVIRHLEELLAKVVVGEMKPGTEQDLDLVRGQPLARPSVLGQRLEDARGAQPEAHQLGDHVQTVPLLSNNCQLFL